MKEKDKEWADNIYYSVTFRCSETRGEIEEAIKELQENLGIHHCIVEEISPKEFDEKWTNYFKT